MKILSAPVYQGFGPTLAAEYLEKKHGIEASKETVRQWMIRGKLWRAKKEKVRQGAWLAAAAEPVWGVGAVGHQRARLAGRARREVVPDRDDRRRHQPAVRAFRAARFDRRKHEAGVELPGEVRSAAGVLYGQGESCFRRRRSSKRDEAGVEKDAVEMPPTQIGRALRELGITWIAAHSPQAKGRVERNFQTAQDRLVKGMRVAGVKTIEQANAVPGQRLPGLVGAGVDGGGGQPRRCSSPVGQEPQSGGIVEPRGNAAGAE